MVRFETSDLAKDLASRLPTVKICECVVFGLHEHSKRCMLRRSTRPGSPEITCPLKIYQYVSQPWPHRVLTASTETRHKLVPGNGTCPCREAAHARAQTIFEALGNKKPRIGKTIRCIFQVGSPPVARCEFSGASRALFWRQEI